MSQSVAVRGFREPQANGGFCAHVVVVNLCPNVTVFTVRARGVPEGIGRASHEFEATNDVPLSGCATNATAGGGFCDKDWGDSLGGYRTAVYRLGCDTA